MVSTPWGTLTTVSNLYSQETYGRNRESIVDIEEKLHKLFSDHPKSYISNEGVSVIPGDNLVDILRLFAADSFELMTPDEVELLNGVVAANPGLEVTAQLLLGFIADRTKAGSPPQSPTEEQPDSPSGRGRTEDREVYDNHSRSSSSDSIGTSVYRGPGSRPPSRGPQTPTSGSSVFDTERRQRSTPLGANAPSSWTKRPPAPHRRKSDAGSRSDSEARLLHPSLQVYSNPPSSIQPAPAPSVVPRPKAAPAPPQTLPRPPSPCRLSWTHFLQSALPNSLTIPQDHTLAHIPERSHNLNLISTTIHITATAPPPTTAITLPQTTMTITTKPLCGPFHLYPCHEEAQTQIPTTTIPHWDL